MLSSYTEENSIFSGNQENKVTPVLCLMFHNDGNNELVGVTKHPIEDNIMQDGEYISPVDVRELLKEEDELNIKPECVIAENRKHLMWYSKSRFAKMWFRISGNKGHNCVNVKWPTLLFIANKVNNSLKVFALDSDEHPTGSSKVYHAPLMNIGFSGEVCQGTARLPRGLTVNSIKKVEDTIYESNFTHVNHKKTLQSKKDVSTQKQLIFWQKRNEVKRKIPASKMVEIDTLTGIISNLK